MWEALLFAIIWFMSDFAFVKCATANEWQVPAAKTRVKDFSVLNILDSIHSSADVKALSRDELPDLCAALRGELIQSVSQTGGHLASNLGAVELTVALHRVYDSATDRIVFDVGHQCYAHKLLTGRREQMSSLRKLDGISGFPKPCEADDDAFIAGHASSSVSAALGMARARTLLGENYDVCAVIGDGALTGGLAYEGLSDCGMSGEPIVVVLNDNEMSISRNVGGMDRLLARQRVRPGYIAFKKAYRSTIGRYEHIYKFLHRIKEWIKDLLLPDNMFEDMGFYYLGPIDGHDVRTVTRTIRYARDLRIPVLVHIRTVKGKGYAPAEENPSRYHGVAPFDPEIGVQAKDSADFSAAFGAAICEVAQDDPRVVALTAAMSDGTGLIPFAEQYPERFFDVGIAEGHAVTLAAGMAKQGLKPVLAVYSTFLQRGFDELIHDVALQHLPVVFAVDRAGLVGADGETHQGSFDVGYLSAVPGMKIWSPSNFAELRSMLRLALASDGPAAVRYPRGTEGAWQTDSSETDAAVVREGTDLTIVSYGVLINEALRAADMLAQQGISAEVVKLNRLDTLDGTVPGSVGKTGMVIVAEEAAETGCVGVRILAGLEQRAIPARSRLLHLGDGVVEHGSVPQLWHKLGLDAEGIVAAYTELIQRKYDEESQN